jgi:hypothetical protein
VNATGCALKENSAGVTPDSGSNSGVTPTKPMQPTPKVPTPPPVTPTPPPTPAPASVQVSWMSPRIGDSQGDVFCDSKTGVATLKPDGKKVNVITCTDYMRWKTFCTLSENRELRLTITCESGASVECASCEGFPCTGKRVTSGCSVQTTPSGEVGAKVKVGYLQRSRGGYFFPNLYRVCIGCSPQLIGLHAACCAQNVCLAMHCAMLHIYDPLVYVAPLTYSLLATCLLIFFPIPRPSCLLARPQCCFPGGDGDNAPPTTSHEPKFRSIHLIESQGSWQSSSHSQGEWQIKEERR